MSVSIDIDNFLDQVADHVVIDVRSPGEFGKGHIPSAHNIPLFEDEERQRVGICYKAEGRRSATLMGLDIVGPKMRRLAEAIHEAAAGRQVLIHCWRGGMRSHSVAWLLEQVGGSSKLLEGGYKAFRRRALLAFEEPRSLVVLSGMTGAGKTVKLHEIQSIGEQVIDLEALACHRGSSFGGIGLADQPTCEQFENELFMALRNTDPTQPLWLEDESPSIGKVRVPSKFWWSMRDSPAVFLDVAPEVRAANLAKEYGGLDVQELISAVSRLRKRLGGLATQQCTQLIEQSRYAEAAIMLLVYYDKTYRHAAERRPRKNVRNINGCASAQQVVEFYQSVVLEV